VVFSRQFFRWTSAFILVLICLGCAGVMRCNRGKFAQDAALEISGYGKLSEGRDVQHGTRMMTVSKAFIQ
jgi:hypothetical protein